MKSSQAESRARLRERLENLEKFEPLLSDFIQRSISECNSEQEPCEGMPWCEFYAKFTENNSRINAAIVQEYCESPIERIFMNSLILLFMKNQLINLHITEPSSDTNQQMNDFRTAHGNIMQLAADYVTLTGDSEMKDFKRFFAKKIDAGYYTEDDFEVFEHHRLIVQNFTWHSFHITLQAGFPALKIDGKGVRVDLLVWKPDDPSYKVVVECDGFEYHKSKDSFIRDRKRDRLFLLNGYKVIRFSGSEIYRDPIQVSSDLYDLLISLETESQE